MTASAAVTAAPSGDRDLLYGSLLAVATELQCQRYNAALEALTGRRTGLTRFHVDISGFSPEVAEELGDPHYLNPHGCNRLFILLTLDQAGLPLVDYTFTSSAAILQAFLADNRERLFALTLRDVVYGELENSVFRVETIQDIVSLKSVRIRVDTAGKMLEKSAELERRIAAFQDSDSAWADEQEIAALIALAEQTGDIRSAPLAPEKLDYKKGNFFSPHLGGLYIFRRAKRPTVITCGPTAIDDPDFQAWLAAGADGLRFISVSSRQEVAEFLRDEGMIAHVAAAGARPAFRDLDDTLNHLLVDHMASEQPERNFTALDEGAIKRLIYQEIEALPPAFHAVSDALRYLEQGGRSPKLQPNDPGYFYLCKPRVHEDSDLAGHLLARLAPLALRQLYLFDKPSFRAAYETWPENQRAFVTHDLRSHVLPDEAAERESHCAAPASRRSDSTKGRSRIPASQAKPSRKKRKRGPWSDDDDRDGRRRGPWRRRRDDDDDDDDDD